MRRGHKKGPRKATWSAAVEKRPPTLKRVPVFASQVPFLFNTTTDAWEEVVLPPGGPGAGVGRGRERTRAPPRPSPACGQSAQPPPDGGQEGDGDEHRPDAPECMEPTASGGSTIKLCTMNVLFDMFDEARIQTKRRMPALIELLRASDADIIGLQEVTQPFLIRLLREEWVQRSYWVSDGPLGYSLKPYYGQLILSKIPFHRLLTHQFSRSKKVTIAQFVVEGCPVWVPVVHLTSNRKGSDLYNKRHLQLQVIFEKICPSTEPEHERTEIWMMGDLNFEDGEEDRGLPPQWQQFVDLWPALHPSEPGYTYDPQRNSLAAACTSSGKSRRIDRVMVRSGAQSRRQWEARSIELIGTEPLSQSGEGSNGDPPLIIFPSDHFGLVATLATTPKKGV